MGIMENIKGAKNKMSATITKNGRTYHYKLLNGLPQCQDCGGTYSWEQFYRHVCKKGKVPKVKKTLPLDYWQKIAGDDILDVDKAKAEGLIK